MKASPKIGVIGCGWSGLTMCRELKKWIPLADITLFGDPSEIQAHTITVNEVSIDVGTCYLHPGYKNTVYPMVKEEGFETEQLPIAQVYKDGTISAIEPPSFWDKAAMIYLSCSLIWIGFVRLLFPVHASRLWSMNFDTYLNSSIVRRRLSSSFHLTAGCVAQGYGFFSKVSTYRLAQWLKPGLFHCTSADIIKPGGYGQLARHIYNKIAVTKIQTKVRSVTPRSVTLTTDQVYSFDYIMICCPLDQLNTPLALFPAIDLTTTPFTSFAFVSDQILPGLESRIYIDEVIKQTIHNRFISVRYFGCGTMPDQHIYWGVAYGEDNQTALINDAESLGIPVQRVLYYKTYPYNPRFTQAALDRGVPGNIKKKQGQGGLYYLGGTLSHWDVDSIYEDSQSKVFMLLADLNQKWAYWYHIKRWYHQLKCLVW